MNDTFEEVIVALADGKTLRSSSEDHLSGDYVRLCAPDGTELLQWDKSEWECDPALVMGAILNSAAGLADLVPDPNLVLTEEQAQTELERLQAERDALTTRIVAVRDRIESYRKAKQHATLNGRTPDEFWTDPDLRRYTLDRAWNSGMGERETDEFIAQAVEGLAPGDFYRFNWDIADDHTIRTIRPTLTLTYEQNIDAAHAALLNMARVLSIDGLCTFDVLEHTCSAFGSITLTVDTPTGEPAQARVMRRGDVEKEGPLSAMLDYLAKRHWQNGGPPDVDYGDYDYMGNPR